MHARANRIVGQDGGIGLVSRHSRDDIGTLDHFFHRLAGDDVKACMGQVAHAFRGRFRIEIIQAKFVNAEQRLERHGLEFALRAIADNRHGAGILRREIFGGNRRSGSRAQRREDGHFGQKHRIAAADIGQNAESRDGLKTLTRVLRVAVDIFEAIERAVARRHQLDHAFAGVGRDTRGLVEIFPATEILFHVIGEFLQESLDADGKHQLHHVVDTDEGDDVEVRLGHSNSP